MRIGVGILVLVALGTVIGTAYEALGRRNAALHFPPQGELVDIGGRRIQLDCRGTGTPTVVFESGLDILGSLSWSKVHDEIAKTTRACAYSRAGIMWSDPDDGPRTSKSIAEDLHSVLKQAGEQNPLVLVGHSLGGPYAMTYTKYFGSEVAGIVFVDASHPDQVQRLNAAGSFPERKISDLTFRVGAALNWTGVVRAVVATEKLPEGAKAYASTSLGPMLKEQGSIDKTLLEAGTLRQLGDRPVFVLTAMAPMPERARQWQQTWKQLHDEQAAWSLHSQHQLVPDAGHYIQFERPDVVINAVKSVVFDVRKSHGQ